MTVSAQQMKRYLHALKIRYPKGASRYQLERMLDSLCLGCGIVREVLTQHGGGNGVADGDIGACGRCQEYVKRSKDSQPFSVDEIELLRMYSTACDQCSDNCLEYLDSLENVRALHPSDSNEGRVTKQRDKCDKRELDSILSKKELEALESRALEELAIVRSYQQPDIGDGDGDGGDEAVDDAYEVDANEPDEPVESVEGVQMDYAPDQTTISTQSYDMY